MSVPLTLAGRSPFDPIRLRWGGLGAVVLGVVLLFQGATAGVVFGIFFALLGIATWAVTRMGATSWLELTPLGKGVAGTGAIVGLGFLVSFFLIFFLVVGFIKLIVSWM
jgi:hypothetical protein